jgi:hypothetical protein
MNMRIDGLIENTLRNSRLRRVRVKVDPSQLVTQGYENVSSFEGYVLEECGTTVQVYLLNVPKEFDNIQNVDKKHVTPAEQPTLNPSFENFKKKILRCLEQDHITAESPLYKQIVGSCSADFMEAFLRDAGYDDKKLLDLYKKVSIQENIHEGVADVVKDVAKGLKGTVDNPIFKVAQAAAKGVANVPGLFVGKKNIIGRLANFMKTLDVKDLIEFDNFKKESPAFADEPKKGNPVFINNLPFSNLPQHKAGNISYQIRGTLGSDKTSNKRRSTVIQELDPSSISRQLEIALDYAALSNNDKTGTLILDFLDAKLPTRYYEVKVDDYQNNLILTVTKRLDERKASISQRLIQDETLAIVKKALEEFLGDKKIAGLDHIIKTVAENILKKRDTNIMNFDKAMSELLKDPKAQASTNPDIYIKKVLGKYKLL